MDPATVALLIRALDVGFLVANWAMHRADSASAKSEMVSKMQHIAEIQKALEAGTVSEIEAQALIETLANESLSDLRHAMGRL